MVLREVVQVLPETTTYAKGLVETGWEVLGRGAPLGLRRGRKVTAPGKFADGSANTGRNWGSVCS